MSKDIYNGLLAHGAPELPDHLFYAIRTWHDDRLFADNHVTRISINERVERPNPVKLWFWNHGFRWCMDDPTIEFVCGRTLPLVEKHPYHADKFVVAGPDDLLPTLVRAAQDMWDAMRERHEEIQRVRRTVALAESLEGDHP